MLRLLPDVQEASRRHDLDLVTRRKQQDQPWAREKVGRQLLARVLDTANRLGDQTETIGSDRGGLLLANTTNFMRALASLRFRLAKGTGKIPSLASLTAAEQVLVSVWESGEMADFKLGNIASLQRILLCHAVCAVPDWIGCLADVGRAWRLAAALGLPLEVMLAGPKWQRNNMSIEQAFGYPATHGGPRLDADLAFRNLVTNFTARERLYRTVGLEVNCQDIGTTIDADLLEAMTRHFVSSHAAGTANEALIGHLGHALRVAGNPAQVLRYYLVQYIAQLPYVGNSVKSAPLSEQNFDRLHALGLDLGQWLGSYPAQPLAALYDGQYQLIQRALPYNPLSLDTVEQLRRRCNLAGPLLSLIPLSGVQQNINEVALILEDTPLFALNRLLADVVSFLLLCERQQPSGLAGACRMAETSSMADLLGQLGGQCLADGWLHEAQVSLGADTRNHWATWFNSLVHADELHHRQYVPHLWFILRSGWTQDQYKLLATMMLVAKYFYQAVTGLH